MRRFTPRVAPALLLLLGLAVPFSGDRGAALGQVTAPSPDVPSLDPFVPPIGGGWEPPASLGQPPRWRLFLSFGYGLDRTLEPSGSGGTLAAGIIRDLFSPVYGALAISGELYAGQRGDRLDGGARLSLESPAIFLHTGLDWNLPGDRVDWAIGFSVSPRRGGIFTRGGEIRGAYLPGRNHSFSLAATLPIRQPLAGRTRPRVVDVPLPRPPREATSIRGSASPGVEGAIAEVLEAMHGVNSLANVFWRIENESLRYEASVREWREVLGAFVEELELLHPSGDGRTAHGAISARYHLALDRAFGVALGAGKSEAEEAGRLLADRARRVALEEVVLPYNRTIGQYKDPDRLDGLLARARARWDAWVELEPPAGAGAVSLHEAGAVFDRWILQFESARAELAELTGDARMRWLPMALVLREEEYRTQEQIDGLVELALGKGFEPGNAVLTINALQFIRELERSLHETESYHVLWIHDYRGRNAEGLPDQAGLHLTTEGYLRALLNAVRRYDETGRLPFFTILLDQHFYELNDGRRWMTLLEDPLRHRVSLGRGHEEMARTVEILQDSLRLAVAGSVRLQAEARAFGSEWFGQVVKVHVNITNPSDLSFRSLRLLRPPIGADNLLRDHRKVVIRDVFDDDPASGEVILAGVGVGEHYATATWEDRALLIQGPGTVEALRAVREVLAQNRLDGERLPTPLRARVPAADHGSRVAALEAGGASARFLQVHNQTGWGDKDATFLQMLLYDLAPPGTLLLIPNSLWTSFQWMAHLVSAALRGCHVYLIGPAIPNAPSAGFPQRSVIQELLTRLMVVDEVLGDRIREGGGDLRVGLYDQTIPLDDLSATVEGLERAFRTHPFLAETFPFPEELWEALRANARTAPPPASGPALAEPGSEISYSTGEGAVSRPPQLHRKTEWMVSREVLRAVVTAPGASETIAAGLGLVGGGTIHPTESGFLPEQERMAPVLRLLALFDGASGAVEAPLLYYASGSMNKNVRSMALDGEALGVVAGSWAIQPLLDFALLAGGVSWIADLEELERRFPPYSILERRIGRWLQRVL